MIPETCNVYQLAAALLQYCGYNSTVANALKCRWRSPTRALHLALLAVLLAVVRAAVLRAPATPVSAAAAAFSATAGMMASWSSGVIRTCECELCEFFRFFPFPPLKTWRLPPQNDSDRQRCATVGIAPGGQPRAQA
jgi:hypothetical protein